jgi:hypothetical protein
VNNTDTKSLKKGGVYHSQKRAAGARASLGLDEFVSAEPVMPREEEGEASPGLIIIPKSDPNTIAWHDANVVSDYVAGSNTKPPFIQTVSEPASLVYAPMLSQPALAKAQINRALEAVNDLNPGGSSAEVRTSGGQQFLLPELISASGRSSKPKIE